MVETFECNGGIIDQDVASAINFVNSSTELLHTTDISNIKAMEDHIALVSSGSQNLNS